MTDDHGTVEQRGARRFGRPAALVAAGVLAGGIAAATVSASAQSSPTPSPSSGTSTPGDSSKAPKDLDSPTPVRDGETALTGTNAEKARAAALKAVPGGTIIRLETDSGPAEYEAHMKKADGTRVTVLFDSNFNVTSVEQGMGGGPGGHGGRGGDGSGATPSAAPSSA